MSRYKNEQHHVSHNGRTFHFVSYEGHNGSTSQGIPAAPASWFLISAGKRWQAITQEAELSEEDLNRKLIDWLSVNIAS